MHIRKRAALSEYTALSGRVALNNGIRDGI